METATQTLHRLSSYEPGREWDEPIDDPRVLQDLGTNDLERLPWFFKRYAEELPRVELPRELPTTQAPAVAVLAGAAEVEPAALDLPQLSRLLHLAAGVVRTTERPYGTWLYRAAGSAGSRSPFEVYVAVPEGGALPAGVHWYHPQDHALVQIGPPPRGGAPTIVVTGVPWRTGWRYRERGYRHTYWDVGTMLAQLLAAADSAGLEPALYSRFPDEAVRGARRRRRRPRMAGRSRRARRRAGARGDGRGRGRRGGRRARRVPARHRGSASRRARRAGRAVGAWRAGGGSRAGNGLGRAGRPRAQLAAAARPRARAFRRASPAARSPSRCAASTSPTSWS